MSGKGSAPRPISNRKQYAANFDAIFSKKIKKSKKSAKAVRDEHKVHK